MSFSQSFIKSTPTLPSGSGEDYWSLDDVLAGQERIPSQVEQPLYRLGYLNSHCKEEHLLPGTKLELPLWLARALCTRRRKIVSVQLPRGYHKPMRLAIMADANVIDFHRNGPYYYNVGLSLLHFDLPERGELAKTLLEAYVKRFRRIMDSAHNAYLLDTSQFTNNLDEMEKYLFSLGQEALMRQINWERGHCKLIGTSSLVESGSRKRKRENVAS